METLRHELIFGGACGKLHLASSRKNARGTVHDATGVGYVGALRRRDNTLSQSSFFGSRMLGLRNDFRNVTRSKTFVPLSLRICASINIDKDEKVSNPLRVLQEEVQPAQKPSRFFAGKDRQFLRVPVAEFMKAKEGACISLSKVSVGVVAAAAALLLQQGPALAMFPKFELDGSPMQKTLVEAWSIVHDTFVDPTFNKQDWDSKFQETLTQLAARSTSQTMTSTGSDSLQLNSLEDDMPAQSAGGSLPLKTMPGDDKDTVGYKKIGGMLDSLGDPFTRIISPKEYDNFRVRNDGSLQGVGMMIAVQRDSGRVLVLHSIEGSPAARAGILPGDELVQINDEELVGVNTDQAAGKLRGKSGTTVTVKLVRKDPAGAGNGEVMKEVTLRREQIHLSPVTSTVLTYAPGDKETKKVGYIRLSSFPLTASSDMEAAIRSLQEKDHVDAFILDLRDNPGGLVKAGLDVAQMFLDGNDVLVNTIDRDGTVQAISAVQSHALTKDPLVVLVNANSASASEILAAALHDNGRAVLVGSKTYGKGRIQSVSQLSDGSALFVTVAKYVSPALHPIDKVGIVPDVVCTPEPVKDEPTLDLQEAKAKMLDRVMIWNSKEKLPGYLQLDSCVLLAEHQLDGKLISHSNS